jgi:photosystem II stability/assembly factor-like uncharacterized protein
MRKLVLLLTLGLSLFSQKGQAQPQKASSDLAYSWKKLDTEPYRGKQDDIFFLDERRGWYVNGAGKIFRTRDAGETWEKQLEKPGTFFRCVAFLDSLQGFAGTIGTDYFPGVTDTIPLYGTRDGGKTWAPVAYKGPYVKGLCALDIVRERVVVDGKITRGVYIYGVGRVGSPANLIVSKDGGQTFTSQDMSPYAAMLFDIKMFNSREGFACAASGEDMETNHARIIATSDGGRTWRTVYESTRPYEIAWKMHFPTREVGYATLQHYNPDTTVTTQHFLKTIDGGKTWQEGVLVNDHKARSFGVGFLDAYRGFIGTMTSGFETRDGGLTWTKIDLGRATNKIRIGRRANGWAWGYAIGVDVRRLELGLPELER